MGAHEYETIVDDTIIFLDQHGAAGLDVRSWVKSLYELQGRYDTCESYTDVLPQLVRNRYVYVLPADDRAETLPCDFSSHPAKDLSVARAAEYPAELRGERFYVVAGSPAWRVLVELGELTGPDAIPPMNLPLEEVVARIVLEAEKHENRFLVRGWLPLLCIEMVPRGREALSADPNVQIVRRVAKKMDVLSIRDAVFDYGNLTIPPDYDFGDGATLTWLLSLDDV